MREQESEDPPRDADKDGSSADAASGVGWQEFMGKDLMMKVEKAADDDGGADGEVEDGDGGKKHAEMHDAVYLDVVGYRISSSAANGDGDGVDGDPDDYTLDEEPFLKADGVLIALGQGDVCNGIEMAARFLNRGDRGTVRCASKYAYGPGGRRKVGGTASGKGVEYDLAPNSDVVFRITLTSIVSAESPEYNTDAFRIVRARAKKDLGNDAYKHEWYGLDGGVGKARALRLYKKAGDDMSELVNQIQERKKDVKRAGEVDEEKEKEALTTLVDCLNNISAAHMRAKDFGKAKEAAANAIQHDPNNMKALLRAARAAMLDPASTYEESDAAIGAAEEVDAEGKEVRKLRAELTRKKKEYKQKQKAMYGKMMGGAAKASGKQEENGSGAASSESQDSKGIDDNTKRALMYYALLSLAVLCWSFYVTKFAAPAVSQYEGKEERTPGEFEEESEF